MTRAQEIRALLLELLAKLWPHIEPEMGAEIHGRINALCPEESEHQWQIVEANDGYGRFCPGCCRIERIFWEDQGDIDDSIEWDESKTYWAPVRVGEGPCVGAKNESARSVPIGSDNLRRLSVDFLPTWIATAPAPPADERKDG